MLQLIVSLMGLRCLVKAMEGFDPIEFDEISRNMTHKDLLGVLYELDQQNAPEDAIDQVVAELRRTHRLMAMNDDSARQYAQNYAHWSSQPSVRQSTLIKVRKLFEINWRQAALTRGEFVLSVRCFVLYSECRFV